MNNPPIWVVKHLLPISRSTGRALGSRAENLQTLQQVWLSQSSNPQSPEALTLGWDEKKRYPLEK